MIILCGQGSSLYQGDRRECERHTAEYSVFPVKKRAAVKTLRHECLVCLRNNKDVSVTRAHWVEGQQEDLRSESLGVGWRWG